jgi:hypothetical protein
MVGMGGGRLDAGVLYDLSHVALRTGKGLVAHSMERDHVMTLTFIA